jgi:hypothetical protein
MHKIRILLVTLLAALGLAAPAVAASAAQASQKPQSIVGDAYRTHLHPSYAVQQVNPTTYTNVLSKTVPAIPMRAGSWIIRTRSCSPSTCYEVTSQGEGLDMVIEATGFSTFNRSTGSQGDLYITPHGLCPHATTDGLVIASSSCGVNNTSSQWKTDANGHLINPNVFGYMGENSLGNNTVVKVEPTIGAYYDTPVNIG